MEWQHSLDIVLFSFQVNTLQEEQLEERTPLFSRNHLVLKRLIPSMRGTITTHESGENFVFEWRIQGFSTLPKTDGACYYSPDFSFGGERWYLGIYPNGWNFHVSSGHMNLLLSKYNSGRPIRLSFSLSLKTAKGERHRVEHHTKDFADDGDNWRHRVNRFIPRAELTRLRSNLLPDDVLTVVCTMKGRSSAGSESHSASAEISTPVSDSTGSSSDSGECRHCSGNFAAGSLSSHQRKCEQRPVKCPDCSEVVVLQKFLNEHECQQESPEGASSTAECPHCKLTLEAASLPTHEKSCMDRPMKCPQCGEDVATKLWLEHKCLTARTNAIGNLLQDLKRIMICGEHSDVTVNVRGEEFRLHRNILGARNPFFGSRFNNESQEATPDALSLDDCDPDQFRTLIHYIYTGTADSLCPENVCGLYEVAVAYQEPQMRAECLQLMMNTLCVDNFCDYTVLALKHKQEELLQKATELFVRKVKEITRHEKWEAFLESYPAQANKLYMEALNQQDQK